MYKEEKYVYVPIEEHFAGDYRIEYDGKYITLFGKDRNYEGFRFSEGIPIWYEEMVLIPVVEEIRNASPRIISFDEDYITIKLYDAI